MSDGATTTNHALYVGLAKWLGSIGLLVLGGIQIAGNLNVQERVTVTDKNTGQQISQRVASGVVLQTNGLTVRFYDWIPLTMTGGVHTYDMAYVCPDDYGIVGSGIVLNVGLDIVKNPAGGKFTIAYQKAPKTASSSLVLASTQNRSVASGAVFLAGSASGSSVNNGSYSRWNGADCIAVKSLTNPTSSGSGYLMIEGRDDLSE